MVVLPRTHLDRPIRLRRATLVLVLALAQLLGYVGGFTI
jgi:hypothetical protein